MSLHRDSMIARADRSGGPTSFLLQSWLVVILIAAVIVLLAIATVAYMT